MEIMFIKTSLYMKHLCSTLLVLIVSLLPAFAQKGLCGENLTWKIKGSKLIISGKGEMSTPTPSWSSYASEIKEIKLPAKLTSICDEAFASFHNLEKVNLPKGLEEIGSSAFYRCKNLKEISLPSSIAFIGLEAFAESGLVELNLPRGSEVLDYIEYEDTVKVIREYYLNMAGIFKDCKNLRSVFINYQGDIPYQTFKGCRNLRDVYFSTGCSIGSEAFYGCTSLESIEIPNDCTHIGGSAFSKSSIKKIHLPSSLIMIDNNAFEECSSLTEIVIDDGLRLSDDSEIYPEFWDSYYEPIRIYDWKTYHDFVLYIGKNAFKNCKRLTSVVLPTNSEPISLEDDVFSGCESLKSLDLSNVIHDIPKNAFHGCKSLESVIFSDKIVEIADSAFFDCTGIVDLSLPNSLKLIGREAFRGCKSIKKLIIPEGVETLGFGAFRYCTSLENVSYPKSLVNIDGCVFDSDNKINAFYGEYSTKDNRCVVYKDNLVWFASSGISSYQIPENIKQIGDGCFADISINSILLPKNGVSIGSNSFWGSHIRDIIIPPSSTIGYNAFAYCNYLEKVIIEDGVKGISSNSFRGCNRLRRLILPSSLTWYPKHFVSNCPELNYVFIPNTKDKVSMDPDAFPSTTKVIYKSYSDLSSELTIPPVLTIKQNSLKINSPLGDGEIGCNSNCTLTAQICNEGERVAQMCIAKVNIWGTNYGVNIDDEVLYSIKPGEIKNIVIPFRTTFDTGTGKVTFSLFISEQNGYDSNYVSITAPIYAHGTKDPKDLSSEGLKYVTAAIALAEVAKKADDLFPAIAEYKKVNVSDPAFASAYYDIAKLYTTLGKEKDKQYFGDAKTYYTKYKRLVPEDSASIDAEIYTLELLMK